MEETVFNRIEKKYLMSRDDKRRLLKQIKRELNKDSYHKTDILNLYFDNSEYDLITQSIDWVDYKLKVRARSYVGYDKVFMEIKTKLHARAANDIDEENEENIGYKRRVLLSHDEFSRLINEEANVSELVAESSINEHDLQIAREIDYLIKHFKLKPRILVSYHRESYRGKDDLRITFDSNLKYRTDSLRFEKTKHDKMYFKDNRNIIMEVKASGAIPFWLSRILSEQQLYPEQFSKIGKIYERIKNV